MWMNERRHLHAPKTPAGWVYTPFCDIWARDHDVQASLDPARFAGCEAYRVSHSMPAMPDPERPDSSPPPAPSDALAAELGALEAMLGAGPDEPAPAPDEGAEHPEPSPDETR